MSEKLFAEFPPVTTEQWEEVINKDLKGADYDKKLVWKTICHNGGFKNLLIVVGIVVKEYLTTNYHTRVVV